MPCVYTIADKPILSRAQASLPESYLQFGKVDEGNYEFKCNIRVLLYFCTVQCVSK